MQYVPILVLALIRTLIVHHQKKQMGFKDERLKLMNEVLGGMKVLKLYAWEPSFEALLGDIRRKEMAAIRKIQILQAVTQFMWQVRGFFFTIPD